MYKSNIYHFIVSMCVPGKTFKLILFLDHENGSTDIVKPSSVNTSVKSRL